MSNKPYSALAPIYEKVVGDNDYAAWAQRLVQLVNEYSTGKTGLDMACGSGYFTRALTKSGFSVDGVDLSTEMLNEALMTARKEGLFINFRKGDMSTFKNFTKVDFITVVNDGINYIAPEKLLKTFQNFYRLLDKGGTLFFDISTDYKLKNVIGNNIFSEDTEDMTYVWFNTFTGDRVNMDISVFTKDGDKYVKSEESQTQYVYTIETITENLEKCGYKSVIVQNHMGGDIRKDSLRAQFIAKKA